MTALKPARICELPLLEEPCDWCGEPAVRRVAVTLGQVANLCADCLDEWRGPGDEDDD